jgi:restriction system protein
MDALSLRLTMPKNKNPETSSRRSLTLDQWLSFLKLPQEERPTDFEDYHFPTDEMKDEYINTIKSRSDAEIKGLLRILLPRGGTYGSDHRWIKDLCLLDNVAELVEKFEYMKRLLDPSRQPWEGMTWILDLIPHWPSEAISALEGYSQAQCQFMPDGRASGLWDCIEIIRARYLEEITELNFAEIITPRDFEFLVASLYIRQGYKVKVTIATRDGGHDILAEKDNQRGMERLLIECKRVSSPISVAKIRALAGTLDTYRASKGILVCTSSFTGPATEFSRGTARLELIDRSELCKILNTLQGARWTHNISQIVSTIKGQLSRGELLS